MVCKYFNLLTLLSQIETAVKFLKNPKVINSPLAHKQKFLQKRGLSEDEIRLACERSGAYDHHEQLTSLASIPSIPQSPNTITSYHGYGPMQVRWFDRCREIIHSIAIFSIVAYVLKKIYEVGVS